MSNPVDNILDQLTGRFAPTEKTVSIEVMPGTTLEFEVLSDQVRHNEVFTDGAKWVSEMLETAKHKRLSPAWSAIWANDPKLLGEAFLLANLAKTPGATSAFHWFKMARSAAPLFRTIYGKVMAASIKDQSQLDSGVIDAEKKGAKRTRTSKLSAGSRGGSTNGT